MLDLIYFKFFRLFTLSFLFLNIANQSLCTENDTFLKDMVLKHKNEYISLDDEKLILYANPSVSELFVTVIFLLMSGACSGTVLYNTKFKKKYPDFPEIVLLGITGPTAIYLCKRLIKDIDMKKGKNVPYVTFDAIGIYLWGELVGKWLEIEEIWIRTEEMDGIKIKKLLFCKKEKSLLCTIPAGPYLPIKFTDLVKITEHYWGKYYNNPQN